MSDPRYLIDTNVISEVARREPDAEVSAFIRSIRKDAAFMSVLTIGELRRGAAMRRRVDRRHADRLDAWIDSIEDDFATRILPVDLASAELWGRLSAVRSRPIVNTLIAATALAHDLILVTRNTIDVRDTGAVILDPWEAR